MTLGVWSFLLKLLSLEGREAAAGRWLGSHLSPVCVLLHWSYCWPLEYSILLPSADPNGPSSPMLRKASVTHMVLGLTSTADAHLLRVSPWSRPYERAEMTTTGWLSKCHGALANEGHSHIKSDSDLGFLNWPFSWKRWGMGGNLTLLQEDNTVRVSVTFWGSPDVSNRRHSKLSALQHIVRCFLLLLPPMFYHLKRKPRGLSGDVMLGMWYLGDQTIEGILETLWNKADSSSFSSLMVTKQIGFSLFIRDLLFVLSLQVTFTQKPENLPRGLLRRYPMVLWRDSLHFSCWRKSWVKRERKGYAVN